MRGPWTRLKLRPTPPCKLPLVRPTGGVLPRVPNVAGDFVHPDAIFDLGEEVRAVAAHPAGVTVHDGEVGADGLGQIGLVDDEQVGLGDAGSAFAGDLVAPGDIDDLNGKIGQLPAKAGGEIVAAGLEQEQIRAKAPVQLFERLQVQGDVIADGGMRAAPRLHRPDSLRFQRAVTDEEFAIFFGENIVGDCGDAHGTAEAEAKLEHQGCFAAADRTADADGEGALAEIPVQGQGALVEMARVIGVGMAMAMMRMAVGVIEALSYEG